MKIVCVGGGAASFFFAAEVTRQNPGAKCVILEQGKHTLGKVKISGGGRCNVTHHCFKPKLLVENYPRGGEVLLKPFKQFGPRDTVKWFESRGVKLKTEDDGRMFPVTDSSQSIIDCLTTACKQGGVEVRTSSKVEGISRSGDGYSVHIRNAKPEHGDILFVGAGSSRQVWQMLEKLGHKIVPPVPSLFTFLIQDTRINGLSGITIPDVRVSAFGQQTGGPMLITHKGLSGPAILKMSAFAAIDFFEADYKATIKIDFVPEISADAIKKLRDSDGKKLLSNHTLTGLPKRLHLALLSDTGIDLARKLATLSNADMAQITSALKSAEFQVKGQNRFKEEFVTAGGVDLSEMDLLRFKSDMLPNLYMAGEVLNIDAVTGGFNFQAAWTGGWLAASSVGRAERS